MKIPMRPCDGDQCLREAIKEDPKFVLFGIGDADEFVMRSSRPDAFRFNRCPEENFHASDIEPAPEDMAKLETVGTTD